MTSVIRVTFLFGRENDRGLSCVYKRSFVKMCENNVESFQMKKLAELFS